MKRNIVFVLLLAFVATALTQCTVIREGEVGVKRKLGKYNNKAYTSGLKFYNPLVATIERVSTQTNNIEVRITIPSKEGLSILSDISILYRIQGKKAPDVLRNIGTEYESNIILPVFRSAIADVTSRYMAKDMHSGERATIEEAIKKQMMVNLGDRGIEIEAVLMKSIKLPKSLAVAIEEKLAAEQSAQRMQFVLQEEKAEAERKKIEAEGIRDAQKIITEGLSPMVLRFKAIEAFVELAKSQNAKVIITDGDMPMFMNPTDEKDDVKVSPAKIKN